MNHKSKSPAKIAWQRFRKNPLAMCGLIFILFVTVVALAGPTIRPDSTVNANDQNLALARQKPGFVVSTIRIRIDAEEQNIWKTWLQGGRPKPYREVAIRDDVRVGVNDSIKVELWNASPSIHDSIRVHPDDLLRVNYTFNGPHNYRHEKIFLLGTDKYGRDLLSRLMAGSFVSLSVGLIAVFISLLAGLTLGLLAGYYRGRVDAIIMWFTNVVWAIPTLLLVMAITFAFGTGFWKVFLAVGLTMWVEVARIVRGQVLSVREKEYIEAARALGLREGRIIFRHILPNIISPVIVISAANFASAILIEAGLSFLGLGAQIPTPSWGNMIREHYSFITTELAYLAILPGVLIMMLVLSFMLVGNGLRDALDVRQ